MSGGDRLDRRRSLADLVPEAGSNEGGEAFGRTLKRVMALTGAELWMAPRKSVGSSLSLEAALLVAPGSKLHAGVEARERDEEQRRRRRSAKSSFMEKMQDAQDGNALTMLASLTSGRGASEARLLAVSGPRSTMRLVGCDEVAVADTIKFKFTGAVVLAPALRNALLVAAFHAGLLQGQGCEPVLEGIRNARFVQDRASVYVSFDDLVVKNSIVAAKDRFVLLLQAEVGAPVAVSTLHARRAAVSSDGVAAKSATPTPDVLERIRQEWRDRGMLLEGTPLARTTNAPWVRVGDKILNGLFVLRCVRATPSALAGVVCLLKASGLLVVGGDQPTVPYQIKVFTDAPLDYAGSSCCYLECLNQELADRTLVALSQGDNQLIWKPMRAATVSARFWDPYHVICGLLLELADLAPPGVGLSVEARLLLWLDAKYTNEEKSVLLMRLWSPVLYRETGCSRARPILMFTGHESAILEFRDLIYESFAPLFGQHFKIGFGDTAFKVLVVDATIVADEKCLRAICSAPCSSCSVQPSDWKHSNFFCPEIVCPLNLLYSRWRDFSTTKKEVAIALASCFNPDRVRAALLDAANSADGGTAKKISAVFSCATVSLGISDLRRRCGVTTRSGDVANVSGLIVAVARQNYLAAGVWNDLFHRICNESDLAAVIHRTLRIPVTITFVLRLLDDFRCGSTQALPLFTDPVYGPLPVFFEEGLMHGLKYLLEQFFEIRSHSISGQDRDPLEDAKLRAVIGRDMSGLHTSTNTAFVGVGVMRHTLRNRSVLLGQHSVPMEAASRLLNMVQAIYYSRGSKETLHRRVLALRFSPFIVHHLLSSIHQAIYDEHVQAPDEYLRKVLAAKTLGELHTLLGNLNVHTDLDASTKGVLADLLIPHVKSSSLGECIAFVAQAKARRDKDIAKYTGLHSSIGIHHHKQIAHSADMLLRLESLLPCVLIEVCLVLCACCLLLVSWGLLSQEGGEKTLSTLNLADRIAGNGQESFKKVHEVEFFRSVSQRKTETVKLPRGLQSVHTDADFTNLMLGPCFYAEAHQLENLKAIFRRIELSSLKVRKSSLLRFDCTTGLLLVVLAPDCAEFVSACWAQLNGADCKLCPPLPVWPHVFLQQRQRFADAAIAIRAQLRQRQPLAVEDWGVCCALDCRTVCCGNAPITCSCGASVRLLVPNSSAQPDRPQQPAPSAGATKQGDNGGSDLLRCVFDYLLEAGHAANSSPLEIATTDLSGFFYHVRHHQHERLLGRVLPANNRTDQIAWIWGQCERNHHDLGRSK